MNLSENCKILLVKAGQASGDSAITTDLVDMAGYKEVIFIGNLATNNAGNFVNLQQDDKSNGSTLADLKGTRACANKKEFKVGLARPEKRYVALKITRAGAATVTGNVWAILFKAAKMPKTSETDTLDEVFFVSPGEGTP